MSKAKPKKKLWTKSAFSFLNDESSIDLTDEEVIPTKKTKEDILPVSTGDWIAKFEPLKVEDLAVHNKKIEEVLNWLNHYNCTKKSFPGQICLITGPAGSAKTATVRVLAKQEKYVVKEWVNSLDVETQHRLGDYDLENEQTYKQSQLKEFKDFVLASSRYKGLLETSSKNLVLVEDFPNVFLKNTEGFTEILQQYKKSGRSPLIFIVTDSKSRTLNISYNLFPESLKEQLGINHISFNPVASTFLKKALKRVQSIMAQDKIKDYYKPVSQDIVDTIGLSSQGDLRNAIINLHFSSLKGAPSVAVEVIKNLSSSQKSRNKKAEKKLKSIGKDESVTMMHAIGRVFNPKYEGSNLTHQPEDITESFSSEPKNFLDLLYANYLPHFSSIENALEAVECFGSSDLMMTEYRESQVGVVGLNVAIRGLMVSNEKPVTGWMPVKGPKRLNRKDHQDVLRKLGLPRSISLRELITDYKGYVENIRMK
ncbi:RAD17 family protein [Megaselia abdita]